MDNFKFELLLNMIHTPSVPNKTIVDLVNTKMTTTQMEQVLEAAHAVYDRFIIVLMAKGYLDGLH